MTNVLRVSPDEPDDASLLSASLVITSGGVIVYPTETLYGIGANALDAGAVEKVLLAKHRTERKPILVIIHAVNELAGLIEEMPSFAQTLVETFWPGPLTLVFRAGVHVPDNLTQKSGTIGIRIPSNTLCLKLLSMCECPLTSTSANIAGGPVLRSMSEIRNVLTTGIDLYLDAGVLPTREPSTVVDVTGTVPSMIRDGAISFERIHQVTPNIQR